MSSAHLLYLITDGRLNSETKLSPPWMPLLRESVPFALQLREKQLSAKDLFDIGKMIKETADTRSHPLVINDRIDVAMALNARGVHLAHHSLDAAEAKRIIPPNMMTGVSVHSLNDALRAEESGADYLLFGHVYSSRSKPGLPPKGVEQLAAVVERVSVPVVALGGIDRSRINEVLSTGCAGIAMISAIFAAVNPISALHAVAEAITRYPHPPKSRMVFQM